MKNKQESARRASHPADNVGPHDFSKFRREMVPCKSILRTTGEQPSYLSLRMFVPVGTVWAGPWSPSTVPLLDIGCIGRGSLYSSSWIKGSDNEGEEKGLEMKSGRKEGKEREGEKLSLIHI